MNKPNCYACKHRRNIPGDAHSSCAHPKTGNKAQDAWLGIMSMLINVEAGRPPAGSRELGITANAHGINSGWFYWPYNYDPAWLLTCNGFEPEAVKPPAEQKEQVATG